MEQTTYLLFYKEGDSRNVSVDTIESWMLDNRNKELISNFISERLKTRFLKPFTYNDRTYVTEYKNGFAIMACCCLLIETLQCFYEGLDETPRGKGDPFFKRFFERAKNYGSELGVFAETNLYADIRCGILHQGEVKKGFRITRNSNNPIYNKEENKINAVKFLNALSVFIDNYVKELNESEWDSEVWDNCRRKLRSILKNAK